MTPPARLLRSQRDRSTNILIVGGAARERQDVARAFHESGLMRSGPFVAVDGRRDERRIRRALEAWILGIVEGGSDLLRLAERGTLFLDSVGSLSDESQRMLLAFTRRRLDPLSNDEEIWVGRLAAGSPDPLAAAVRRGRFSPALYDALDKVRVKLPLPPHEPEPPVAAAPPARRRASRGGAGAAHRCVACVLGACLGCNEVANPLRWCVP